MRIIVKEHMWILVIAISVVVISGVIGDAYPKRVALDTANSDQDFEMIEIERKEQAVRDPDESSLSSDKNVYEMGIALCFTQDRTRTCDCGFLNQDFTLPIYSGNMHQLNIRNCKRVIIRENSFANIYNIAHLELENIEDLVLHSNSLAFPIGDWGHVNILMRNIRVDSIPPHTFNGFIQGLTIQNSIIGGFERFAANGIRSTLRRLQIADTVIGRMEPYAFKKFTVDSLEINNVTTHSVIPSKFFYALEVNGLFAITNCNFSVLQPSAFDLTNVDSFALINNEIQILNGEAFRMALLNGAAVQRNYIHKCDSRAFQAITINENYWRHHNTPMSFRLTTNRLATIEIISPLILSDKFSSQIDDLRYLNRFYCENLHRLKNSDFFTSNRDAILFHISDQLLDGHQAEDEKFHSLSYIANNNCVSRSWFWYYIIIGGTMLLILILTILVLLCVWYRRRKAQQMSLIVPDGRTYRETTIVMQIENHNLLKTDL